MKVTFFSNFLTHHQLPFCIAMHEILGEDFKFVATEPIHEERLQMGYEDMSEKYQFTLNTFTSNEKYETALNLGEKSDVVITGSAPDEFIKERLRQNKLTFRYSERIFKRGRYRILRPRTLFKLVKNHTAYRNRNVFMLCASAYTAADFNLVGAYKKKTFKWGYFPEVKEYDLKKLMSLKDHDIPKILWAGRLLDWKHPDDVVKLAYMLKENGYLFQIDIIGTGEMKEVLEKMIQDYDLSNQVSLLGSMSPEKVREYMESANVYLFTSDFQEGWGAVLNESMNSGCAVVASHAIGAVPFLLENNKNGLIYKNGDIKHLYQCVSKLLDNKGVREQLSVEAYSTINGVWNAKNAAYRIIKLSESILNGKKIPNYEQGPCSLADVLSQKFTYWK
ncbi:MAG: glycosyltransferase family 4 protein [Bacillota bacterium]